MAAASQRQPAIVPQIYAYQINEGAVLFLRNARSEHAHHGAGAQVANTLAMRKVQDRTIIPTP